MKKNGLKNSFFYDIKSSLGRIKFFKKYNDKKSRFEKSSIVSSLPIVVFLLISSFIALFYYLFNTYNPFLRVENNGYMIGETISLDVMKKGQSKKNTLDIVSLKEYDYVFKTPLNRYMDSSKNTINVEYPLFINDGISIVNYNDNTVLFDVNLLQHEGLTDYVFSYGKAFQLNDYESVDDNKYILMGYSNNVFINLYDLKVTIGDNDYFIPVNSIVCFTDNQIYYFERSSSRFIHGTISNISDNDIISFQYESANESHRYHYSDFLIGIGRKAPPSKIPAKPIINESDFIEEEVDDVTPLEEEFVPTNTDFEWVKPTVTSSLLTPTVYSMTGSIHVSDPAGVIVKAPTYTLYVNGKTYSRRSFFHSGNIIITGVAPSTTYHVVGQYTYLDEDMKTKKLVTFYSGEITSLGLDQLDPIDISYSLGDVYSRKIELSSLKITSDLKSEAIKGVRNVGITVGKETFLISKLDLINLLNGEEIHNIATGESLQSNKKYSFTINFYDISGNLMNVLNNTGKALTSKREPSVVIKVAENEIDYVVLNFLMKNPDNIDIGNFRYVVTNSGGQTLKSGNVESNNLRLDDLDPNQMMTIKLYGDVDLDDGRGMREKYLLGSMEFTTLPISSLGYINFNIMPGDYSEDSIHFAYKINQNKTDVRLSKLLKNLKITITNKETEEVVRTIDLDEDDIVRLKDGYVLNVDELQMTSNSYYKLKFYSVVQQGNTVIELDCILDIDEITTRKKPAVVLIENSFTTNEMIDFDAKVVDVDGAILSKVIRIELRDLQNRLLESKTMGINEEEFSRITFNHLKVNTNYVIIFIADEYNETFSVSSYESKHELLRIERYTDDGISGRIELRSSARVATGENLIDMYSDTQWQETTGYYTIPKKIDEDGNIHIFSKTSSSNYSYDLSEYEGEFVTATFKIKAITRFNETVFFSNYLGGSTNTNQYAISLANVRSDSWTTFSYTFKVGYRKDGVHYIPCADRYYGRNRANFAGFYINAGTTKMSEYMIRDFEIHLSSDHEDLDLSNYYLEPGYYNTNGTKNNTASYLPLRVRVNEAIAVQPGHIYNIYFSEDTNYTAYVSFFDKNNTNVLNYGWFTNNRSVRAPDTAVKMTIHFRYWSDHHDMAPGDLQFRMVDFTLTNPSVSYQDFEYDFVTLVKLDVYDKRNEVTGDTYYIKVLDEEGNTLFVDDYRELVDVYAVEGAIKRVLLEENRRYTVQLMIKIREREYILDFFEISTFNEVKGISTSDDWAFVQPHGNYIVLNDIDFRGFTLQAIGFGYRYFYGEVDFQGYKAILDSKTNNFQKIGRIEKTGVLKNLVLEVHFNNEINNNGIRGFVSTNYGTIENIEVHVYDEREIYFKDYYVCTVADANGVSGVVRNFVMKLETKVDLFRDTGLLVRNNYGLIENGYVYGENATFLVEDNVSSRTAALVAKYGGVKSTVRNVYVLSSYDVSHSYDISGLVSYETYGEISNTYTVGQVSLENQKVGPVVGYFRQTADLKNVYYLSDALYTMSNQTRISEANLNDVYFQKNVLQNGFNVDELVTLGYYPHVLYSYTKMPKQEYNPLPEYRESIMIDIVSMSVRDQNYNSATIDVVVENELGDNITGINISNLKADIISQRFEEGKSYIELFVSEPTIYTSKYEVRGISAKSYNGYTTNHSYGLGEKYLFVDFFKEIHDVEDWVKINKSLAENYVLMADLDFREYSNYYLNNFSGKLEGNNHVIKNITVTGNKSGLFNQMNGVLQNISFLNFVKKDVNSYYGIVGYSNSNARYYNVHVSNVDIVIPETRTADTIYAGALIGNNNGRVSNCSVSDVSIVSSAKVSGINVGGLAGRSGAGIYENDYAQDVYIDVIDAISTDGVGGLVGYESSSVGVINSVYVSGFVHSSGRYVGGIVGRSSGLVEYSYTTASIMGDLTNIAGIVGNASTDNVNHNLFLGSIASKNSSALMSRIVSNVDSNDTNYAYRDGTVNGFLSDLQKGENLLSFEELFDEYTYSDEVIALGPQFDYSRLNENVLPQLFYMDDFERLLPNQKDNIFHRELLPLVDIYINKRAEDAAITLYFDNPNNYLVDSVDVTGGDVELVKSVNYEGKAVVDIILTPSKYYDSYHLNTIVYRESEVDEPKELFKFVFLELLFYKYLRTYDDWQNVSKTDAENYILVNDIDFTGLPFNTEVVFNRLETLSDTDYHVLKGMKYNVTTSGNRKAIINTVFASIKNIVFEDIEMTSEQTTSNSYFNIIGYSYGTIQNLVFRDIYMDAYYKSYVGPIGYSAADRIDNILLSDIHIQGSSYVAGFLSYFEFLTGRSITNITADNIYIQAEKGEVASGILGKSSNVYNEDDQTKYTNVSISNCEVIAPNTSYVGCVVGSNYGFSNVTASDLHVSGKSYVGGLYGSSTYNYTRYNSISNSHIEGNGDYIGGISGYSQRLYDAHVDDCTIEGNSVTARYVGGVSGQFASYTMSRSVIKNSNVINNGSFSGGVLGRISGGTLESSSVNNVTVTASQYAAGVVGDLWSGTINLSRVASTVIRATDSYAGGFVGYYNNHVVSASFNEGYVRNGIILDSEVSSASHAGGMIGRLNENLRTPQNTYGLYTDITITTDDGMNAYVASGDEMNSYFLQLPRMAFYEDMLINGQSIKDTFKTVELEGNMIQGFESGFINSATGEVEINYNYIDAKYSNLIHMEAGHNYVLKAKRSTVNGLDTFRVRFYDMTEKYIGELNTSGNTFNYFGKYYNTSNREEITFTPIVDCYIRVLYLYPIDSTSLTEITSNYGNVVSARLFTASELRNKINWTRTLNGINYDYDVSYFIFDANYWDFDTLDNVIDDLSMQDLSGNGRDGHGRVSILHDNGVFFDGVEDQVEVYGYTASNDISVSVNFTPYSTRSYQYLFSYRYYTSSPSIDRGFGLFLSSGRLYVTINGSNYDSGHIVPLLKESNAVVTYENNKILKVYLNGDLVYTHSNVNKTIGTDSLARTYIGNDMRYTGTYKFIGIIRDLVVYNRPLSQIEIYNNLSASGVSNGNGVSLYYDFTTKEYSGTGFYPKLKYTPSTGTYEIPGQLDIPLPTITRNRATGFGIQGAQAPRYANFSDVNLDNCYHIYPSGINTVNIEFDNNITKDISFVYKVGDFVSEEISVSKRVYSISYDYLNDIEFTLKSAFGEKTTTVSRNDLAKQISLYQGNYYHINKGTLYVGDHKIFENAVHLYNNLVLLNDGKIYDIESKKLQEGYYQQGILSKSIPLHQGIMNDSHVSSFYGFSVITKVDGSYVVREDLILEKDGHAFIYDSNSKTKNDSLVVNYYNDFEYMIVLGKNGELYSYKDRIHYDKSVINSNIVELSSDYFGNNPIIMVRYDNGYVVAFNYYSGDILFDFGNTPRISLFEFFRVSTKSNNISFQNDSFTKSNDLQEVLEALKDKDIISVLNSSSSSKDSKDPSSEDSSHTIENLDNHSGSVVDKKISNKYVSSYNSSTGRYDVYDIESILDTEQNEVVTLEQKIDSNELLYSYFHKGPNVYKILKDNRLLIFGIIILIILMNLGLLVFKTRKVG